MHRMRQLEVLGKFREDFKASKLTDEDCIKLGRDLRHDIYLRHNRGL